MGEKRVGKVIEESGLVVFPGVYDAMSALIAQQVGFPLAFVSGYSVAAASLGEPDMGLLTQTEMIQQAQAICRRVDIPILVDADTGYGNPLNVQRTVHELIQAGAAGCFLEDQVWPKRCGHMRGKQVIAREEYLQKISAAVDARGNSDFFIVARTDALATDGLDAAIDRVTAARELGADASFVEAPESTEQLEEIGQRSPSPNVANMIGGGRTPLLPRQKLRAIGFQLVLYPLAGLFSAARTLQTAYQQLLTNGTVPLDSDRSFTFAEFNQLIGADEKFSISERYSS